MKIVADLHTHTVASSDGFSTLKENIQAAAEKGLLMLAVTDHGPALPFAPHHLHFPAQRMIPDEYQGVRVLRGIEANILDSSGTLDITKQTLALLDIVVAGLHEFCNPPKGETENTEAIIGAIGSSLVDIISHPANPLYPVDLGAVVEAAAREGVALELNNNAFSLPWRASYERGREMVRLGKECGALFCVNSDAHFCEGVGVFDRALELIAETALAEDQVLNTGSERIWDFLKERWNKRGKKV